MNKNKEFSKKTLIAVFVIIVIALLVFSVIQKKDTNEPSDQLNNDTEFVVPETEIKQSSEGKDKKVVEINTDGNVDVKQLSNYTEDKDINEKINQSRIEIQSIGSYSGAYVEDGTNEAIEDILAIVVTNTSKEFLQYSEITLSNGKEKATFTLSNVPSGASALVLSKEKTKADGNWSYQEDKTAFIENASLYENLFSWEAGDNTLRLTNKCDNDFKTVYVYYKNIENGIYVGGITYRVKWENLKAGETVQRLSKHFDGDQSQIMMIDYLEE